MQRYNLGAKRETKPESRKQRSEASFQRQLIKKLKAIPNSHWFVKEAKALRGIADIIGCVNGRFVALEVKKNASEANKNTGRIVLQKRFINHVNACGGLGAFVYPENEQWILDSINYISSL